MKSYCVKQKKVTECVEPSGYKKTKNGRLMFFCKCAECGITKTKFAKQKGGALYRRKPTITDKIAEGAAMFVNPTASWGSAFKLLGSQGLKGITDNVKRYRRK